MIIVRFIRKSCVETADKWRIQHLACNRAIKLNLFIAVLDSVSKSIRPGRLQKQLPRSRFGGVHGITDFETRNRRHMQGFCQLQLNAHDRSQIKNSLIEQQISQVFWRQLFGRGNQHCSCGTILMSPRSKRKVSKKHRGPYVRVPEYLKW